MKEGERWVDSTRRSPSALAPQDRVGHFKTEHVWRVAGGNQGGPGQKPDEEEWSMKVRILGVVVLTALILAVAFSVLTLAAPKAGNANAAPTPAATAVPATATPPDHPEIRDALGALRHAREHLEHAAHDFGGHRAEALHATDEAIHQLEICLKYDK